MGALNPVTPSGTMFPGDIVTHVDDVMVESFSQSILKNRLDKARTELKVTIAVISPLRKSRHSYTRLHETVMTDTNMETPSSAAFLHEGKTD